MEFRCEITRSTLALVCALTLSLAACSKKDGHPDDDDGNTSSKAQACEQSRFAPCAQSVLTKSSLSSDEVASLSNCSTVYSAAEQTSTHDVFETARQAVLSSCL